MGEAQMRAKPDPFASFVHKRREGEARQPQWRKLKIKMNFIFNLGGEVLSQRCTLAEISWSPLIWPSTIAEQIEGKLGFNIEIHRGRIPPMN